VAMQRLHDWKEQISGRHANLGAARLAKASLTEEAVLAADLSAPDLVRVLTSAESAQEVSQDARFQRLPQRQKRQRLPRRFHSGLTGEARRTETSYNTKKKGRY